MLPPSHAVALVAGILSDIAYFRKGENHLYVFSYMKSFFAAICTIFLLRIFREGTELLPAAYSACEVGAWFLAGVSSSLLIFRVFFNPLNRFPGSFGARISSFWLPYKLRYRDGFRQVRKLHDKHGYFVRLGPNYVSIAHPKGVSLVYGGGSKCTKASWYDLTKPMISLQTFREKSQHDERRRVWSAAFGDKALRGYEQRLQVYRNKLMDHIMSSNGEAVNVTQWFNSYGFDFMGDLAFGKSFHMLENQKHWAIDLLNDALEPLAFGFPVWFFRLLTSLPVVTRDWWRFIHFCAQQIEQRLQVRLDTFIDTPPFSNGVIDHGGHARYHFRPLSPSQG